MHDWINNVALNWYICVYALHKLYLAAHTFTVLLSLLVWTRYYHARVRFIANNEPISLTSTQWPQGESAAVGISSWNKSNEGVAPKSRFLSQNFDFSWGWSSRNLTRTDGTRWWWPLWSRNCFTVMVQGVTIGKKKQVGKKKQAR